MKARDRRALVLGAAVLAPALAFTWVGRPAIERYQALRREVMQERDLLARERALLAAAPALEETARGLDSTLASGGTRVFPGGDPLAATAALGAYVSNVAREHRVHVQQGETRPPQTAPGGLVAVEAAFRLTSDLQGLLEFLLALETGPRRVVVARLGVERTLGIGGAEPDQERLNAVIVVRGFAEAGAEALEGAP